jgi:hypothetical protein
LKVVVRSDGVLFILVLFCIAGYMSKIKPTPSGWLLCMRRVTRGLIHVFVQPSGKGTVKLVNSCSYFRNNTTNQWNTSNTGTVTLQDALGSYEDMTIIGPPWAETVFFWKFHLVASINRVVRNLSHPYITVTSHSYQKPQICKALQLSHSSRNGPSRLFTNFP